LTGHVSEELWLLGLPVALRLLDPKLGPEYFSSSVDLLAKEKDSTDAS